MANITVSPNMSLPVPVVGQEPGSQFATDVNNCLSIIDSHNHALGSGIQITPSGLNINSSLPMNGQSLISIGALTFQAISSDAIANSLYEKGVDLFYRDGNGNIIRITQSGSVAGSSGTITGLPSGTASAAFAAGVFTFQASTNTGANIDAASYVLRNNTAGSFGLTLQPPNAMGSNYSLTLPSLPAQTNVMTLDVSGNMSSITYDQVGQAMSSIGADTIWATTTRSAAFNSGVIGQVVTSSNSGTFTTNNGSYTAITNQFLTIQTSGKPVQIMCISDGLGTPSFVGNDSRSGTGFARIGLLRDATIVSENEIISSGGSAALFTEYPISSLNFVDIVPAGTYTYTLVMKVTGAVVGYYVAGRLIAFEI